ncbi:SDR family NAD(P)-dependent oxidoreductase (plasmid) [Limosilactobacillus panis]|uniref:SDR family NAD(P)-dependent oxidoreductase n=1 Tax=Limosilactobacillus panis TaxID=47493 RepID=UPI001C94A67C|nr:SDR family NAD(P)-dependent oxidoreductase [Limosilactobacillus panis]QZN94032.1 SDR family NAD(P)-dependent oxidoreductase [Limosilactobacillus panis]
MTKTVLITGGSRGLGAETAKQFAQIGYNVVVNYFQHPDLANKVVADIGADHAIAIKADVRDRAAVDQMTKEAVDHFVFELKQNFYSFKLSELSAVRSKYSLTLLKLWNANSMGKLKRATIKGTLEEWESWFLGTDKDGKPKKWSAGRFRQRVLGVSMKELGKIYPKTIFYLTTEKTGRKVTGYQLDITPVKTVLEI